jgi:hypothetical protein
VTGHRRVLGVALAMAVASAWLAPVGVVARTPGRGPDLVPADGVTWREVLDRAVAATATGYEASMVVVSLGDEGPGVTEVELRRDADGGLTVAASEAWLIARDESSVMFRDEAGELVPVGQVPSLPFTLPEVERNYEVDVAGRCELLTGPAVAVAFRREGVLRERMFVDDATGVVVRRETYDRAGVPVRVTALTDLRIAEVEMETMPPHGEAALGERTRLSPDEVRAMAGHGWDVPTTIGDGFDLRAGFGVDDGAAVQLVYSDGLYTMSVFEQPGRVDPEALEGAVRDERHGIPVYRWPGAEPERMVWNGDGHTFTAVTDAPADVLMAAVADLPHDRARSLPTRVRRGFARLGSWLWPFG